MPYDSVTVDSMEYPTRLHYIAEARPTLSEEQVALRSRISRFERIIREVFISTSDRQHFFSRLTSVAIDGLTSTDFDGHRAIDELEGLEAEMVQRGLRYRSSYIKKTVLGSLFFIPVALTLFVGWIILFNFRGEILKYFGVELTSTRLDYIISLTAGFGFSFVGLMLGTILHVLLSNRIVDLDSLRNLQKYKFSVGMYCFYLAAVLIVFFLMLTFDVVQVGVGGILLNEISSYPWFGLFVGLLCALAEPRVAALLRFGEEIN